MLFIKAMNYSTFFIAFYYRDEDNFVVYLVKDKDKSNILLLINYFMHDLKQIPNILLLIMHLKSMI